MAESDPETPASEVPPSTISGWARTAITAVALVAIGLATLLVVGVIWITEPEAQREGAVKRTAMLVEVARAEHGTFRPRLQALGAVRPFEDVALQPRVTGQVLEVSEAFVPGQVVDEGELLVRIDPADAQNRLVQAKSALEQAEAALALEKGRQSVAQMERDQIARQLDGGITADQEALIVREPQLRSARAQVEAARAAVTQAQLDLQRTRVVAPFRALVLERTVHPGSRVGPGTDLGRLVGVDRFFVELTVPAARLRHLATPADGEATTVELVDRASWTREQVRTGKLQSVLGQVDDQTRLARVLVAVRDPLALDPSTQGPPLMAGAWVEATLEARVLEDVVRIDRAWLRRHRGEDAVWEMVEGRLKIREVEVLLQDEAHAYLSAGLAPDAQIVTTDLSTVTDDAPLRIANGSP